MLILSDYLGRGFLLASQKTPIRTSTGENRASVSSDVFEKLGQHLGRKKSLRVTTV